MELHDQATQTGQVYGAEQKLARLDALRTVSRWAAQLSFDESNRGSLETGKHADLVVTNHDYLNCPEAAIRDIKPLCTIVAGKTVFERGLLASE